MKEAFQILAFGINGQLTEETEGFAEYTALHKVTAGSGQMLLGGRALIDLSIKDKLYTKNNQAVVIVGFHMYGKKTDFCGNSCSCVMICTKSEDVSLGDTLSTEN